MVLVGTTLNEPVVVVVAVADVVVADVVVADVVAAIARYATATYSLSTLQHSSSSEHYSTLLPLALPPSSYFCSSWLRLPCNTYMYTRCL